MKIRDIFGYSFSAIKLRKLRSGLTILGVVIGIAAIVALLSITQGLQSSITQEFTTGLSADTLTVTSGSSSGFSGIVRSGTGTASSGFKLYVNYTQDIVGLSPGIDSALAVIQRNGYIRSGNITQKATIIGVDYSQYANLYSSTFVAEIGTIPLNPLNDTIVIGQQVSDPSQNGTVLFSVNSVAQILWTNTLSLPLRNDTYSSQVAAILKPIGGFNVGGVPSDSGVYIPISQAQSFFGTTECDSIIVKLKTSDQTTIDNVSKVITDYFGNEVTVQSATAVLNTMSTVFSTLQLFLVGIAAISLLVAGIGIMNIMIVSLMERTREIGVLKALGMKSRTVLSIFLCEAVIIGLIGAVIGIASGWGLASLVGRGGLGFGPGSALTNGSGFAINPVLTPTVFLGALAFGIVVSIVFALYPAWRASKIRPSEAMRYE